METESEFVTAPSTPEPAATPAAPSTPEAPPPSKPDSAAPSTTPEAAAPSTPEAALPTAPGGPDILETVIEQRLLQQHDDHGGSSSMTTTIFRVPAHVRDANKELYEPRLVSIGPYYRSRPALRAMEHHKWRYLRDLLREREHISLADCVRTVRAVEHRARRCYSEPTTDIVGDGQSRPRGNPVPGPDDFGEMLLLDGCFLLQFFINWNNEEEDELCDVGWGLPLIHSDLLLLENQIPFFVLEALFGLVAPEAETSHLRSLILPHLRLSKEMSTTEEARAIQATEIHHLLHLFYEAIVPGAEEMAVAVHGSPPRPAPQYVAQLRQMGARVKKGVSQRFAAVRDMHMPKLPQWMMSLSSCSVTQLREATACFNRKRTASEPETPPMVIPSVTLLRKAGVRFEKKESPQHMFDVTFDAAAAAGVVRMPRLEVDHANKPLLVNLAAFEQTVRGLRGGGAKPMSSYAALVSSLMKKGKDVKHLQKRGIVDNLLGSDDHAAAEFFQQLGDCSSLDYENHIFAHLFTDLDRYYRSSWRRHKAKFLRDHCRSPWAVLALAVAACAFCFALFKFSTTVYGLAHPYCHC